MQFFSQSEHRDRLIPSPPLAMFVFIGFLRTTLSPSTTPFVKKSSLEEMEEVNDNASAFMDLNINIKANK